MRAPAAPAETASAATARPRAAQTRAPQPAGAPGAEAPADARARIVDAARLRFATDLRAPVGEVARDAAVSRATLYRYFPSRADLLAAVDLEPHPGTDDRILAAAAELVGRDGLRNLSMDELAAVAGVSRASVYRLFPGKTALFAALVRSYSPFQVVEQALARGAGTPPEELLPAVVRDAARAMEPRIGIARSLLFEVTAGEPDAVEAAAPAIRQLLGALGAYLAAQMAAGRIRRMHPLLATQLLIGPVLFHLMTRPMAARVASFDVPLDASVSALAEAALEGLLVQTKEEEG